MSKKFLEKMRGEGYALKAKNKRQQIKTSCASSPYDRVAFAVKLAGLPKRTLVDISKPVANYTTKPNAVRAKEKRIFGCRELIRI